MKSLLERLTWVKIVEGILLILLGVLIAVLGGLYSGNDTIGTALAICVAVFLFIDGLLTLFGFLLDPKSNFSFTTILGCLFITIGVVICINTSGQGVAELISMFVAVLLLTSGIVYLIKGCIQISIKAPVGWVLINFIIALLGIVLGTISIIYHEEALSIVFIIIGIAVAVLGVIDLIFAVIKYRNKLKEAAVKPEVAAESVNGETIIIDGDVKEKKKKRKRIKHIKEKDVKLLISDDEDSDDKPKELTTGEVVDSNIESSDTNENNEE